MRRPAPLNHTYEYDSEHRKNLSRQYEQAAIEKAEQLRQEFSERISQATSTKEIDALYNEYADKLRKSQDDFVNKLLGLLENS